MDTNETQGETRICSTCGYERHSETPLPGVSDFCSKWIPPSEDPNNPEYIMSDIPKRNKKNMKALRKETKQQEKLNNNNEDQDVNLKSMFKPKKDAPIGDDNV